MTLLLGPIALVTCLASGVGIVGLIRRVQAGRPLVQPHPHQPVPWQGLDVMLLFLLFLCCQTAVAALIADAASTAGTDDPASLGPRLLANAVAMLVFTPLAGLVLRLRGATLTSLGFRDPRPAEGLKLAVATWVIIVPPLLAVAAVLDNFVVSYRHPVIDFLAADRSGNAVVLVLLSAVVAAPIAEEFFFRRVLQGWLETRLGDRAVPVSAVAFGLAHVGHGLGWVPLIGFGLATGYLARQRGSVLPCIVVHALFNAVSVGLLLLARPESTALS